MLRRMEGKSEGNAGNLFIGKFFGSVAVRPCKVSVLGLLFSGMFVSHQSTMKETRSICKAPSLLGAVFRCHPADLVGRKLACPAAASCRSLPPASGFFFFFSLNKLRVATFGCASPNGGHWLDTAKFSIEMAARANEVAFYGLKARR